MVIYFYSFIITNPHLQFCYKYGILLMFILLLLQILMKLLGKHDKKYKHISFIITNSHETLNVLNPIS